MPHHYKRLRLILGDQLNASHSWFSQVDEETVYVIAELYQEATYAVHHIQKLAGFFASMQQFAHVLVQASHTVIYLDLDQTADFDDLPSLLRHLFEQHDIKTFEYQLPDGYRVRQQLKAFCQSVVIEANAYESEHFYLSDDEIEQHFSRGKRHRMESFYRKMRVKFNVLMAGEEPLQGKWNFDADNRNKLKKDDLAALPQPLLFANDISSILARIKRHNIHTIGSTQDQFLWPINRQQAKQLVQFFCQECLPRFGKFQDSMTGKLSALDDDQGWSLYHSRLSFALNSKMISPRYVVDTAINAFHEAGGGIDIAQIEGFVRQILGWREFIRGVYWANMPEYGGLNHLNATRCLPEWFWTADTKMNCLHHAIKQSLDYAYAHHIQRLMVTGNFCLLADISPDQVDAWYIGIYIDALEWVEMPNTRGMSQFADGGIVGSKPYAASGNYINKMSDYCSDCYYSVKEVDAEDACPLNALYWRFVEKNKTVMHTNPRTKMVYSNWLKKDDASRESILDRAQHYITRIESL